MKSTTCFCRLVSAIKNIVGEEKVKSKGLVFCPVTSSCYLVPSSYIPSSGHKPGTAEPGETLSGTSGSRRDRAPDPARRPFSPARPVQPRRKHHVSPHG